MMFSSDQRFLISGDDEQALKEALRCALVLSDCFADTEGTSDTLIGSFLIHDVHGLVFGKTFRSCIGYTKYSMPVTLDMAVAFVMQYLLTTEADAMRRKLQTELGDGSCEHGWEVHYPKISGNEHIIAVRPAITFYAK